MATWKTDKTLHRCEKQVSTSNGWHRYQCDRTASVKVDGQYYCKQHDPVAKKKKLDAEMAEYRAANARKTMQAQAKNDAIAVLREIKNDAFMFGNLSLPMMEKINKILKDIGDE